MLLSPIQIAFATPLLMVLAGASSASHGEGSKTAFGAEIAVQDTVRWDDLELPAHFVLDLETGVVSSRSAPDRPTLTYAGGWLSSDVQLRALPWRDGNPRAQVERDIGELVSGVDAEVGREMVFDLLGEHWGYLRVVEVKADRVRLEYVHEADVEQRELRRDPAQLNARSGPRGVELRWPTTVDAEYRIDRRLVPQSEERERSEWTELARSSVGSWFDETAEATQLAEYRVRRVDGGFGSRARGVGDFALPGEHLHVGANQSINLLSGRVDDLRVDLEVEFVRSTGVQLVPGPGALARTLTPAEVNEWELPKLLGGGGLQRQRYFLSPGKVLALRLVEGAHARVRVVSIEGEEVTLERLINLDGSRTFPPVPELEEAHWQVGRGVVFKFVQGRRRPDEERSGLIVEREAGDGTWSECVRSESGELALADPVESDELLVRYRFRRWLGEDAVSPSSEPVSILIGNDGGAGTEELLARALEDLGVDDFARRSRARDVLIALGESAWPGLREALRSDNVELAEAARELLLKGADEAPRDSGGGSGDLAGLLLGVRAEELGAGSAPHPDWTSLSASKRASAALRGTGWREVSADRTALWRRVLTEVDPDQRVRLAATMAGALQREGLGPDLRQAAPGSAPWRAASIDAPLQPHPSKRERDEEESAWALLAELQAWHELASAARHGSETYDLAMEHYDLTAALIAQYERGGDEQFLEVALHVTFDSVARLRAALDLLSMQRQPAASEEGGWRVVRLEEPDTTLLALELEELKQDTSSGLLVILPEGIYEPLEGGRQLVAERGRLAIRAEGPVVVRSGFTLMNGCSAVFEGIEISPSSGIALNLVKSRARLEGCILRAQNVGVMGTDATLELVKSEIVSAEGASNDSAGVRLGGRSMLLASESLIESRGVAVYGVRAALFDSCVIVSLKRNALEGNGEGEVWAVGSMLSGANLAIARMASGVLDGVVVLGGAEKAIQAGDELRLCADHLWKRGDLGKLEATRWLESCALHR